MTTDQISYARRDLSIRTVELSVLSATSYEEFVALVDKTRAEFRAAGWDTDGTVRVGARGNSIVATIEFKVDVTGAFNDLTSEQPLGHRAQLAEALGVFADTSWQHMLAIVRDRTRALNEQVKTVDENDSDSNDEEQIDPPIPALLPRNWPHLVRAEFKLMNNKQAIEHRVFRLLDDAVLAAVEQQELSDDPR